MSADIDARTPCDLCRRPMDRAYPCPCEDGCGRSICATCARTIRAKVATDRAQEKIDDLRTVDRVGETNP